MRVFACPIIASRAIFVEGESYPALETLDLSYNSLTPAACIWTYAILGPRKKDAEDYDRSIKQSKVSLKPAIFEGQAPFDVVLDANKDFSYADVAQALKAAQFDPSSTDYLFILRYGDRTHFIGCLDHGGRHRYD